MTIVVAEQVYSGAFEGEAHQIVFYDHDFDGFLERGEHVSVIRADESGRMNVYYDEAGIREVLGKFGIQVGTNDPEYNGQDSLNFGELRQYLHTMGFLLDNIDSEKPLSTEDVARVEPYLHHIESALNMQPDAFKFDHAYIAGVLAAYEARVPEAVPQAEIDLAAREACEAESDSEARASGYIYIDEGLQEEPVYQAAEAEEKEDRTYMQTNGSQYIPVADDLYQVSGTTDTYLKMEAISSIPGRARYRSSSIVIEERDTLYWAPLIILVFCLKTL